MMHILQFNQFLKKHRCAGENGRVRHREAIEQSTRDPVVRRNQRNSIYEQGEGDC